MLKRFLRWLKASEYQPTPEQLLYMELTERIG